MSIKTIFITCDESQFIIPFTCYLNKKYFPKSPVYILGYTNPNFNLPEDCHFVELKNGKKRDKNTWFMDIYNYLNNIDDEYVIFTVDDNPVTDYVNIDDLNYTLDFIKNEKNFGLLWGGIMGGTIKKKYNTKLNDINFVNLLTTGSHHPTSSRQSIWKKSILMNVLKTSNNSLTNFELHHRYLYKTHKLFYFHKNVDTENYYSYKNFLLPDTMYTFCSETSKPGNMINCLCVKNEDVKYAIDNNLIDKKKICYTPDSRNVKLNIYTFPDVMNFNLDKWLDYCIKKGYNKKPGLFLHKNGTATIIYNSFKKYRGDNFYNS
tara:strand:- start:102 stop:1058 length:957 start_codon:yes stop_codon:yes gene_type:complete